MKTEPTYFGRTRLLYFIGFVAHPKEDLQESDALSVALQDVGGSNASVRDLKLTWSQVSRSMTSSVAKSD